MTPHMAREYLAHLGEGDPDSGFDQALQELESEGYRFRPGRMPLAPDGQPTCCVVWPLGLQVQVAACHANKDARALHALMKDSAEIVDESQPLEHPGLEAKMDTLWLLEQAVARMRERQAAELEAEQRGGNAFEEIPMVGAG